MLFYTVFFKPSGLYLVPRMNTKSIKFNLQDQPEFFKELRSRVNAYFKENGISKYGNWNMKLKTVFMLSLYFIPLIMMLTGVVSSVWLSMIMWSLMGFGMSGIGLSVMHDAIHGSYSKNKTVNKWMGNCIHFIGGYRENWRIQHNVLHHSYTNVPGMDEDIELSVIRLSPEQDRWFIHKFQAFYAPLLYGLMTVYWSLGKDFDQIIRYKRKDLLKGNGLTFKSAMTEIIIHKIWYFILLLVLPIWLSDITWWQVIIGYLLMHFICGLTLALIFQAAHVVEETEYMIPDENGSMENNWAIHQMKTTANFANGARLFSWFIGGLNYQIEHHLFPNICHVHYRNISKIVRETAREFNVPYNSHKTFARALKSHFTLLHELGTGAYDKRLAPVKN